MQQCWPVSVDSLELASGMAMHTRPDGSPGVSSVILRDVENEC